MEKTYLFLANGFEEMEALTVVDLLRRSQIEVIMVSIENDLTVIGAHDIKVIGDQLFDLDQYQDAKCIVLPGGTLGTENLKKHEGVRKAVTNHMKQKKLIGAICAAPTILADLDLISGRCVTCYPGLERRLYDAAPVMSEVVVEPDLITSKSAGTAIVFALSLIEAISGKEASEKIKAEIVFMD